MASETHAPAATCRVTGFAYSARSRHLTPAMTVSSGGGACRATLQAPRRVVVDMSPLVAPGHASLGVSGAGTRVYLLYEPVPGYEGPDVFSVTTGVRGRTRADFTVTVVR